jgi:hypothetical protein
MPVTARRFLRKMRGGAQAHLIEADNGLFYVVKFRNNPQHRRVLVNEWIGNTFLRFLQIPTPPIAIVQITSSFLEENPEVNIQLGDRRMPVQAGWHFGSQFPGHPEQIAVYDFIPDTLLSKVANLTDFLGVLAFDKWTGNADARQSIFLRAKLREYAPQWADHPLRVGYVALMVDHGYIFNGPEWDYLDTPLLGLYFRPIVYGQVRGWIDFEPWLERIKAFPEEVVDDALRQIPPDWLNGDADRLSMLLDRLMNRRRKVADLIEDCKRGRYNPFPNWS